MESGSFDVDDGHFFVRDLDGLWVAFGVEFAVDRETGLSGGGRDQIDDHPVADQWFGAPILGNEGEKAVLDLVPLAGSRRKVTDGDLDADLVGEALQLAFPQPQPRTVAAAAIGSDDEPLGLGITNAANILPPATDGLYREGSRVVVDADAHPACVGGKIIDAVGHHPPQSLDEEVADPHLVRGALRPPL